MAKRGRKPKTNGDSPTLKENSPQEQYTHEQMIEALTFAKGMRTLAANRLKCDYKTVCRYIELYPDVAQAEKTARESMLDAVELKLFDRCMKDDTTAIIFTLKTLGKSRGYIEKQININVDMSKLSDDELRAIAEG